MDVVTIAKCGMAPRRSSRPKHGRIVLTDALAYPAAFTADPSATPDTMARWCRNVAVTDNRQHGATAFMAWLADTGIGIVVGARSFDRSVPRSTRCR